MNNSFAKFTFLSIIIIGLFSCKTTKELNKNNIDYTGLWKNYEKNTNEGLVKQAELNLDDITKLAKANGDHLVATRAILAKLQMNSLDQEEFMETNIPFLKESILVTEDPASLALLHYASSLILYNYWQTNQSQVPLQLQGEISEDIEYKEWSQEMFIDSINYHFDLSLASQEIRMLPVDSIGAFFHEDENREKMMLWDYLMNERLRLSKSELYTSYYKSINTQCSVCERIGDEFLNTKIRLPEDADHKLRTLILYQELLKKYQENEQDKLRLITEIEKIKNYTQNIVGQKAVFAELLELNTRSSWDYIAKYALATSLTSISNLGEIPKQEQSQLKIEAISIFNQIIQDSGDKVYIQNSKVQIQNINKKEVSAVLEQTNIPGRPILMKVDYKNLSELHYRIYKLSLLDYKANERWKNGEFKGREVVKVDKLDLPDTSHKFVSQSIELKLESLPAGYYGIVLNDDDKFKVRDESPMFNNKFLVSNLYVNNFLDNSTGKFVLDCINRTTGEQISGADFKVYKRTYNSKKRKQEFILVDNGKGNPSFSTSPIQNEQIFPLVEFQGEFYFSQNGIYHNNYREKPSTSSFIVTDRSIYRPNQEIFFKGVLLRYDVNRIPVPMPNQNVTVELLDPFNQKLGSLEVKADKTGSYHGNIKIPVQTQNGNLRFVVKVDGKNINSYKSVKLEEYKRPKFKVEFQEVEQQLAFNKDVKVQAKAISFSGVSVSNAKVNYKVYRSSWTPYFYRRGGSSFPPMGGNRVLITSGESTTNDEGEVNFAFKAINHDQTTSRWSNCNYSVEIDVIDGTGETHSQMKDFSISNQSVFLNLVETEEGSGKYEVSAANAEGIDLNADVAIKIYGKRDKDFKVNRFWEMADTLLDDRTSMSASFLDYSFVKEEDNYNDLIFESTLAVSDSIVIDIKELAGAGDFKVILSNPQATDLNTIIHINNFETAEFGTSELLQFDQSQYSYQPGEKLELQFGSAIKGLKVLAMMYKGNKVLNTEWLDLNGVRLLEKVISSDDLGGFTYVFVVYYKNRFFTYNKNISVPWKDKELKIITKSIRKVTEPGSKEKWTFTIVDNNGDPVDALLTSSMYDASLDQIIDNKWAYTFYPNFYGNFHHQGISYGAQYFYTSNYRWNRNSLEYLPEPSFPNFKYLPNYFYGGNMFYGGYLMEGNAPLMARSSAPRMKAQASGAPPPGAEFDAVMVEDEDSAPPAPPAPPANVRTNLNETVFFRPDITANEDGSYTIEFDMNESLTTWKLQHFALTPDLKYGFASEEIVTRKELMIQANQVRFLRKGDEIVLAAKLVNLSEEKQNVSAALHVLDNKSDQAIDLRNFTVEQANISLEAGAQKEVFWTIEVPADYNELKLIYSVKGKNHEDAEQYIIPVMPDDIFLIDSKTIQLQAGQSKTIDFDDFLDPSKRSTALTIESTGSPAWYAIRSLPYLIEQDHENSESIFNRYFANSLANKILLDNPKVKKYYYEWKKNDQLNSALSKNDELSKINLNETPWLSATQSEEEVMREMANLFDEPKLNTEMATTIDKLMKLQMSNGGLPWFVGGRDNYYISQYVLEGILRMEGLGLINDASKMKGFKDKLYKYCQDRTLEYYKRTVENKRDLIPEQVIRNLAIYSKIDKGGESRAYLNMVSEVESRLMEKWMEYNIKNQVYMANIFLEQERALAEKIIQSLYERSFYKEQLGRFWNKTPDYVFSSWSIERQASLIELFDRLGDKEKEIDEMKYWLIVNKRTNNWRSTIATSSAIYALTIGNASSFSEGVPVVTKIDNEILVNETAEVGVNYEKHSIAEKVVINNVKEVEFSNSNENMAWANVHYQYFQDYDAIKRTANEFFDLKKEIYQVGKNDELIAVQNHKMKLGDRIRVRLILEIDRPMDFIHLSDDRPSGAEPIDVISGYQWADRISYYKSIKDLGTHFFIDHLERGKYIIEYEMVINNLGAFKSGIAEVQNMYAPEFNDYSKNFLLEVE